MLQNDEHIGFESDDIMQQNTENGGQAGNSGLQNFALQNDEHVGFESKDITQE